MVWIVNKKTGSSPVLKYGEEDSNLQGSHCRNHLITIRPLRHWLEFP